MPNPRSDVQSDWARLGVLFNVSLAKQTPDIEGLLIRTSEAVSSNARLLPTVVTWLTLHERLVCRHRLARMVSSLAGISSATLGLTLDLVRSHTHSSHMNAVIAACRPAKQAEPLFEVDRRSRAMMTIAEAKASRMSSKWGLWTQELELRPDVIRPIDWLMDNNPDLRYRAIFSGNLRASILASLSADPKTGSSESALAVACGATRKALRDALDHLELCRLLLRVPNGSRTEIKANLSGLAA
jgi:hypothetical protein